MVKNLRELRTKRCISQQFLAHELGISQQSINKYENHNVEPDIETLISMARYFDTSVDYLIGNTDSNKPYDLSPEEKHIIDGYRALDKTEKTCIKTLIDVYTGYDDKNE